MFSSLKEGNVVGRLLVVPDPPTGRRRYFKSYNICKRAGPISCEKRTFDQEAGENVGTLVARYVY